MVVPNAMAGLSGAAVFRRARRIARFFAFLGGLRFGDPRFPYAQKSAIVHGTIQFVVLPVANESSSPTIKKAAENGGRQKGHDATREKRHEKNDHRHVSSFCALSAYRCGGQ
jgi:hypothetical protein